MHRYEFEHDSELNLIVDPSDEKALWTYVEQLAAKIHDNLNFRHTLDRMLQNRQNADAKLWARLLVVTWTPPPGWVYRNLNYRSFRQQEADFESCFAIRYRLMRQAGIQLIMRGARVTGISFAYHMRIAAVDAAGRRFVAEVDLKDLEARSNRRVCRSPTTWWARALTSNDFWEAFTASPTSERKAAFVVGAMDVHRRNKSPVGRAMKSWNGERNLVREIFEYDHDTLVAPIPAKYHMQRVNDHEFMKAAKDTSAHPLHVDQGVSLATPFADPSPAPCSACARPCDDLKDSDVYAFVCAYCAVRVCGRRMCRVYNKTRFPMQKCGDVLCDRYCCDACRPLLTNDAQGKACCDAH